MGRIETSVAAIKRFYLRLDVRLQLRRCRGVRLRRGEESQDLGVAGGRGSHGRERYGFDNAQIYKARNKDGRQTRQEAAQSVMSCFSLRLRAARRTLFYPYSTLGVLYELVEYLFSFYKIL